MEKNKLKMLLAILVIFLVLLTIIFSLQFIEKPNLTGKIIEEPTKVGIIYPLSGKYAIYAEYARKGIDLALEDYGGESVKLIYEDSVGDPKEGIKAYNKLRSIDGVSIVMTGTSVISLVVSPLANEDKVIQMATFASIPTYTSEGDFTFRTTPRSEVEDKLLANFVVPNHKRVALIYANNEWGIGHKTAVEEETEKLGGIIVAEETYLIEDSDFRTQLTKIKEQNPEAIFLLAGSKNAGMILKQSKELGVDALFFGIRSLQDPELLRLAGDAAEGVVYTYSFDPDSNNIVVRDFKKRYEAKYGETPNAFSAEGYVAMILLSESIEKCNEDTTCIKNHLFTVKNYKSALGDLSFDENGDVFYPYIIKTIKNGEFVPYVE